VYGPNHGTTRVSGETVTYTPSTGFYGNDSFKYTATNPGGTSYQAYVYIDVGQPPAPSVPILTAPGNGSYTNNNKPQLTWDTTSDATSYKVSLSQDASSLGSPLTVYSNSYTPTSALSDGTWYWQVQACNITGCTPSAEWSFTVDTVAPTVTVTPVTGSLLHGTETFDITIHDTNPASSANQADWVYIYNTSTSQDYGQKVDLSSGSGTFVVNTKDLADGTYDLDVGIVYDAAGNPSGRSDNYFSNYTIDNSPPTGLANLSPSNPTYTTTAGLSSVSWTTAYDPDGPVTYYYESSNSDTTNADGSFVAPVYQSGALVSTTSISASGTPEGTYYWHVQACDALGNCTDWTAPWEIIVDNTRPNVSFVTPTDFSGIFTVGPYVTIDASDTGSGLAIMVLHVYNGSNTLLGICGTANSTELALGSMSCDLSGLPSGVYYIKAGANDKAGNNTTISSGDFTIDTIVLTEPTLISPLNNAIVNGTSLTNSWSTVTGAQTYEYESFNTNDSTQPPRFDATYSTTSKTATNVADGTTFYWRVRAIDQYGQVGPWSNGGDLWKVTVDNTAPVVEITAPTSTYVSGTVTISGTVTDTNPDHYYLVVKDSSGTVVAGPGTVYAANVSDYSWDTTSVADGTYTIDLEARDAAGNKDANSVQTKTVIVDNTAPVTPVALPTGGSYTGSQLVTLSSSDAGSGLAAIYYTTDGTTPSNTHGTLYTTAGFLVSSSETVKAVAYDNVGNESGVMSDSYTISAPIVPTFTTFNSVNNTGTGGNTNTGQVLGASTNTPNTNNGNGNNNGHVKGASTTKNKKNTGNFWGLGWWWLLILALILGLLYLLFRRRKDTENA
ncbi:MAG: Ig-like domain-containing protein, partial [Candidatus Saccharimonadales bacterium]